MKSRNCKTDSKRLFIQKSRLQVSHRNQYWVPSSLHIRGRPARNPPNVRVTNMQMIQPSFWIDSLKGVTWMIVLRNSLLEGYLADYNYTLNASKPKWMLPSTKHMSRLHSLEYIP